ncbi:MAG TPA: hypothetical protein VFL57_01825 [Bryobacteraceae bacterium]|nr:hypothetical protein [Bryobacteraceae bacterium]
MIRLLLLLQLSTAGPHITAVPADLKLDPFYTKYADADGIPVTSSGKVPDAALLVARNIVIHMLSRRPDLRDALIARRWRIGVMAQTEMTTDIPEHRNLKKPGVSGTPISGLQQKIAGMTDKEYWDWRARGLGGNPTTCAEENLLGYPGTKYYGENILIHEFSHAILNGAIRNVDPELFAEVRQAYKAAMAADLWKGHYGASNFNEYWAEGTQTWFWSNYEFADAEKRIHSPEDLRQYDPKLYELLSRVYADHRISFDVYHGRNIRPRSARVARP